MHVRCDATRCECHGMCRIDSSRLASIHHRRVPASGPAPVAAPRGPGVAAARRVPWFTSGPSRFRGRAAHRGWSPRLPRRRSQETRGPSHAASRSQMPGRGRRTAGRGPGRAVAGQVAGRRGWRGLACLVSLPSASAFRPQYDLKVRGPALWLVVRSAASSRAPAGCAPCYDAPGRAARG